MTELATKTILTLDDSQTIRDMLLSALSEAGYRVVQAQDGVEGLARLGEQLPGATGWIVKPFHPEKLLDALRRVGA